jgi:hypothetical protein
MKRPRTSTCATLGSADVRPAPVVASASWLLKHHWNGVLRRPRNKLYCADWVVSTVRHGRLSMLSPVGSPQPGVVPPEATHADSILYVVRAGGIKDFRPMVFTRNPDAYDPSLETLALYGARPMDVVYVPGAGNYCAEHSLSTAHYFDQYDHFRGGTVITDQGNSFKMGSESACEDRGFQQHVTFTPCVHQHLSTLDNGLNGPAKCGWRSDLPQLKSDMEHSLSLMQHLREQTPAYICDCFTRNWFLEKPEVPLADIQALVAGEKNLINDRITYHEKCRQAYLEWVMLKKTRDSRSLIPSRVGLDGAYWASK